MFTCVFIDFENIEKTVRQEFGALLNYERFADVIRQVGSLDGNQIVGIFAYGDFDKGEAGLQTRLMQLGIQPKHVVTKTAHQYLKGSTDIELSLDILETMYDYPHISDFLFLSGDGDLRHIIRRLQMRGKTTRLLGFREHTNNFIQQMVTRFDVLDEYPEIMRQVTKTEKERRRGALLSNRAVHQVITHLDSCERTLNKEFIGLNYFRRRLLDRYPHAEISDGLTEALECELIETFAVPNPDDKMHPTTACRLRRTDTLVQQILVLDRKSSE